MPQTDELSKYAAKPEDELAQYAVKPAPKKLSFIDKMGIEQKRLNEAQLKMGPPSATETGELLGAAAGGEAAGLLKVGSVLESLIVGAGTGLGNAAGQEIQAGQVDWRKAALTGALGAGLNTLFRIGGSRALKAAFSILRGHNIEALKIFLSSPEGEALAKKAGLEAKDIMEVPSTKAAGPASDVAKSPIPGGYKGPPKPISPGKPEVSNVKTSPVPGGYKGPTKPPPVSKPEVTDVAQSPGPYRGPSSVPANVSPVTEAPGGYRGPGSVPKPTAPPAPESVDIMKGPTGPQHQAVRAEQGKVTRLGERRVSPISESPVPKPEEGADDEELLRVETGEPKPGRKVKPIGYKTDDEGNVINPNTGEILSGPVVDKPLSPEAQQRLKQPFGSSQKPTPSETSTGPTVKLVTSKPTPPPKAEGVKVDPTDYTHMNVRDLEVEANKGKIEAIKQLAKYKKLTKMQQYILDHPLTSYSKIQ